MFDNVVQVSDGTNVTLYGRERPALLFDADMNPTHLYK